MVRFFGKVFGWRSSSKATRRSYRPSFDVLEARAVPAVDAFIWFEGAAGHMAPQGETRDAGLHSSSHPAFEIKDFSFGVENPTTIGSATGGAGTGKIKFNEFTIMKMTDQASPAFFKNCCAGAHYNKVTLAMRRAGGDPSSAGTPFLQFKFETVFTTKIDWTGPGDDGPEESISFVYGTLGVKYSNQEATGPVNQPAPVTTGLTVISPGPLCATSQPAGTAAAPPP
jgi:type VI secretion system Hcp family effector